MSNITAGQQHHIQALIDAELIPAIINILTKVREGGREKCPTSGHVLTMAHLPIDSGLCMCVGFLLAHRVCSRLRRRRYGLFIISRLLGTFGRYIKQDHMLRLLTALDPGKFFSFPLIRNMENFCYGCCQYLRPLMLFVMV